MVPVVSKYGAIKTTVSGIRFDSKKESERYKQLLLLKSSFLITKLELQPRYDFVLNGVKMGFYKADFRYYDTDKGRTIIEDVKGFKTPMYNLRKKMMKAFYNIDIFET